MPARPTPLTAAELAVESAARVAADGAHAALTAAHGIADTAVLATDADVAVEAGVRAAADAAITAATDATAAEVDDVRLRVGTTLGVSTLDGAGDVQAAIVATVWGIDTVGDPYFDAAGAAAGQEAALRLVDATFGIDIDGDAYYDSEAEAVFALAAIGG